MGKYIMKAAPDIDFYVEWSTVVDNWTFAGTRAEMLEYLHEENGLNHRGFAPLSGNWPEDRLVRCDQTGTSIRLRSPGAEAPLGSWSEKTIQVENTGTIPRSKLREYVEASNAGDQQAVDAMLTLFVWDD